MIQNSGGYRHKFAHNANGVFSWDTIPLLNLNNIFDYELAVGSYTNVDFNCKYYYYPLRILSDDFLLQYVPNYPPRDFLDEMWLIKDVLRLIDKEIEEYYDYYGIEREPDLCFWV